MKLLIILFSFALVLVSLTILGAILERYWRKYQAERAAARQAEDSQRGDGQASERPKSAVTEGKPVIGTIAQWRERVQTQIQTLVQPDAPNTQSVQQFRTWVQQELHTEKSLQSWLLNLPEPGFALLTQHISDFCTEMNFDLKWLADPQLSVVPHLQKTIKLVVIDYCQACQKSIPVQAEALQFIQYQSLLRATKDKQTQALRRTLHAQLVNQGLTSASDSTAFINATEQERQQQALRAIQEAATKDWSQFAQVLQAVTAQNSIPATNGQSAKAPAEPTATKPAHAKQNGAAKAPASVESTVVAAGTQSSA